MRRRPRRRRGRALRPDIFPAANTPQDRQASRCAFFRLALARVIAYRPSPSPLASPSRWPKFASPSLPRPKASVIPTHPCPLCKRTASTLGARIVVALLMVASGWLTACGSFPLAPSLPSPAGGLELTTNRAAGATLVVNPCPADGDVFPCTRDLQLTFSVVLNRDVNRAIVSTQFYTPAGVLCAAANTEIVPLTSGTPATLTASTVYLSLQGSLTSPECALPVHTTRMVAHLTQENGPAGDLLTQQFSTAYTFTRP